jgi:hypothetical protein
MVFESDPFEDFKRRRQIEMLEIKFKEKAREKQKELARLFQQGDGSEAEGLEEKVEREMLEFFDESTRHVQRLVGEYEKNRPNGMGARVQAEMDEFFRRSSQEAENLVQRLRDTSSPPEIQGRLQNLLERSVQEVQKVTRSSLPRAPRCPRERRLRLRRLLRSPCRLPPPSLRSTRRSVRSRRPPSLRRRDRPFSRHVRRLPRGRRRSTPQSSGRSGTS